MRKAGRFLLWVLAYAATIWLLLMAAGCTHRTPGRISDQTFITDPSQYALAPLLGRWESANGWRLDCDPLVFNGFGHIQFWTAWPTSGAFKSPSQHYSATVVYDLVMAEDSSAVGYVKFAGTRDFSQVLNTPLPDSLSSVIFSVRARYRSLDSLWTGETYFDTTLGDYAPIYDIQPAWRCSLSAEGTQIYPAAAYARLVRYTSGN